MHFLVLKKTLFSLPVINLTLYDLNNIIDGDIQKIIDELQLVDNTERLRESGDTF